ncbi:hypothetical protein SAY87_022199 [Trapa incisa]|uniref:Uncharacterized protein n=1 Tax=Trapa incisa TaxID=236973 RepID=A0AAN7JTI5_9MYRT|nr:hypothetical protein SAY87_022199 [Trapa incisa]
MITVSRALGIVESSRHKEPPQGGNGDREISQDKDKEGQNQNFLPEREKEERLEMWEEAEHELAPSKFH